MKPFDLLKPYLIERKVHIIAGFFSLLFVDLLQLTLPRITKWAIDDITAGNPTISRLSTYGVWILVVALSIVFFRYFWRVFIMGSAKRAEEGIRAALYNHIQTLPATFFDTHTAGDIMAHATNDMTNIRLALGMGIVALTDTVVLGIASIFFMAYIDVKLTLLALLPMPFVALVTKVLSGRLHNAYRDVQSTFSDLMESTRERFAGIKVIKAFNREDQERRAMEKESDRYIQKNMHLVRLRGLIFPLVILLNNFSVAILLGFGGRQVIAMEISPGDFVAFISYLGLLTWPVMALGWVTNLIQRGKASIERINAILMVPPEKGGDEADFKKVHARDAAESTEENPERINGRDCLKPIPYGSDVNWGDVVFQNVSFSYPPIDAGEKRKDDPENLDRAMASNGFQKKPRRKEAPIVLSNIGFVLKKGGMLGIAGPPGSGKSTLASLIPRLYDPVQGTITMDGIPLGDLPLISLRETISFMPQEPFLFSGTIEANLRFGNPDADDRQIQTVLAMAQLTETIHGFPKGLQTVIGEKGVMLSGGQKQRIALARAFLKGTSPILILDDPVSQVDMQTAAAITRVIESMIGEKSMVVISHRFSVFKKADRIIVLEGGRIIEEGTHGTLVEKNGYYAGAWRMQESET